MKTLKLFTLICSLLLLQIANGQNVASSEMAKNHYLNKYLLALSKPNPNYYEIKNAFEKYWNSLDSTERLARARQHKLYLRWSWFWTPRLEGTDGNMSKALEIYTKNIGFSEEVSQSTIPVPPCPTWKPLGPDSIYNLTTNEGVGRITSVGFHRQFNGNYTYGQTPASFEPYANTLFAASISGGIFRSLNGGKNWTNLNTDNLLFTGASDLELSPYNDNEYYFVASFGLEPQSDGGHGTSCIYRSDNGGSTWNMAGAPFNTVNSGVTPYNYKVIYDLEIVPSGTTAFNEYIVVASELGVHRSSDKAVTWTAATMPPFSTNFAKGPQKITWSQADPTKLYLSGGINWEQGMSKGFDSDSIYRSTNRGGTWSLWKTIDINGCGTNTLSLGIPSSVNGSTYLASHAVHVSPTNANKFGSLQK